MSLSCHAPCLKYCRIAEEWMAELRLWSLLFWKKGEQLWMAGEPRNRWDLSVQQKKLQLLCKPLCHTIKWDCTWSSNSAFQSSKAVESACPFIWAFFWSPLNKDEAFTSILDSHCTVFVPRRFSAHSWGWAVVVHRVSTGLGSCSELPTHRHVWNIHLNQPDLK